MDVQEINTILQYVVERNKLLQCLHAKKHALESWRQLVEIILTACPQDLIQVEDRQLIIRDLLQDLHDKVILYWESALSLEIVAIMFLDEGETALQVVCLIIVPLRLVFL